MQIGIIGLGRMGANMARRLARHGHKCVVYDRNPEAHRALSEVGVIGTASLNDFVAQLSVPETVWLMLPAGEPTESTIGELFHLLPAGSTIIDGGNSFYKDAPRRSQMLLAKGIDFLDVGTSGGVWGLERGYCLMIGGNKRSVQRLELIFAALAPGPETDSPNAAERGFLYCGPSGAGHFVKMIHNGIEYGLMQSFAEGFDILHNANSPELSPRYSFNLSEIAELWRHGSVLSSWLLDLTADALQENPTLSNHSGIVEDSGEGRWTILAAIEEAVPAEVLSSAVFTRFRSRQRHTFAERMLSAMRGKFGGHLEPAEPEPAER